MPEQVNKAMDSRNMSLHLENLEVEPSPKVTSNIYVPQTRGGEGRLVKPLSIYRDCLL